jgi:hypothetical protein
MAFVGAICGLFAPGRKIADSRPVTRAPIAPQDLGAR